MEYKKVIDEFCSTFQELHYFVGGICLGFVSGFIGGCLFMVWGVV